MIIINISKYKNFETGDLVIKTNGSIGYGKIVEIRARVYEKSDLSVRYGRVKDGDIQSVFFTIEKVLKMDMTKSQKRKSQAYVYDLVKVDKDLIKKMYKKLNDEYAKARMLKEKGEV